MADRDVVFADQDLADDEPDDLLALLDGQVLGVGGEAGAEAVERLGELEVGLGVVQLGVERVELRLKGGLAFAQLGGAGAELVERDELLLVAVDQASQRVPGAGEVALERVATRWWRGARRGVVWSRRSISASISVGVLEQPEHPRPDELVDLCEADRPVGADTPFGAAVPVGARAAVVLAQDPVLAAGRAAVVGVPALAADEDPLQQRRAPGVTRRDRRCCGADAPERARTAPRSRARAPRSASTDQALRARARPGPERCPR